MRAFGGDWSYEVSARLAAPAPGARPAAAQRPRGLKIEKRSTSQTEVTLAWEQGSAQSFEVQWCRTWGAWQNFATARRAKARERAGCRRR